MDYMGALRSEYESLRYHIRLLTDMLEDLASSATVYQFPDHTQEDIGVEPSIIPIVKHTGKLAIEKALLHYTHFKTDQHQPGPFVHKLAGTLLIECSPAVEQEIRGRVAAINRLKQNFEKLILSLSPVPDVRFEKFKDALPNLCKLSITRQIPLAKAQIKRINYAWTNRKVGGNITRDALHKKIQTARMQPKPSDVMGDWLDCLDREEARVLSYPKSAIFIEIRQSRIAAMMKLHYPADHKPPETTLHAHSPLIILNDKPRISELKTYIKPENTEPTEAKYELIIPRLSLYLLSIDGKLPPGSSRKVKKAQQPSIE